MKIIGPAVQFIAFVLGLFSGYLGAIAPISDETLKIVPGGIASFVALLLLLLFRVVGRAFPTKWGRVFWLASAIVGTLLAVVILFDYPESFKTGTIEVPVTLNGDKSEIARRVKGTELTPKAQTVRKLTPDLLDEDLVNRLGGIDRVWTADSIDRRWRSLTREYAACALGAILALFFLIEALKPQGGGRAGRRAAAKAP
jgi:hypothetical protein